MRFTEPPKVNPPIDPLQISALMTDEKLYYRWAEGEPKFTQLVVRELLMKIQTLRSIVETTER